LNDSVTTPTDCEPITQIVLRCSIWFDFRDPNSPDLSFEWISASASDPKYLSIDGHRTRMADGLMNSSRLLFWQDIHHTIKESVVNC